MTLEGLLALISFLTASLSGVFYVVYRALVGRVDEVGGRLEDARKDYGVIAQRLSSLEATLRAFEKQLDRIESSVRREET